MSAGPSDTMPIIILGCPRSGTTLVRRLINAHPDIHCAGETFLLRSAIRFLSSETVAEGIDYGPLGGLGALGVPAEELKDRLRRFVLQFHEDAAAAAGKRRLAIKTAVDSFYIPQILDLFGGHAKFLCIVRHGMDVAVSLREFTDAMEGPIEELLPFINKHHRLMPAFAAAWAKIASDILEAAEEHPNEILAVRYEDLVRRPDEVLCDLFDFLGEEVDTRELLDAAFRPSEVMGLGDYKTFETRGLVDESIGRWSTLPERVQAEMAAIANPLLARLGYGSVLASGGTADAMRLHELAMMYKNTRT